MTKRDFGKTGFDLDGGGKKDGPLQSGRSNGASPRPNILIYEAGVIKSETGVIFLQPLGTGHATIPHIKAMDVPFHLIYGSLICAKRLKSDRQNKEGCLQTPAGRQNMIIKYLSVGQWS